MLAKFPDLKKNAEELNEFVEYAGAFPPPAHDTEFYMNAIVFNALLTRGGPKAGIHILKSLDIKDWYALFNVQIALSASRGIFVEGLWDEIVEHFGIEELKDIMGSYERWPRTTMPKRNEEMQKIMEFCTQIGFKT